MSQRMRVQSAGVSRQSNINQSAGTNGLMLQDTVKSLRQQLVNVTAENKKLSDQLTCLSTLVKRAWMGDKTAVLHVSNIVGVAPPDIVTDQPDGSDGFDENHFVVKTQPKSRVLNNWARLCVGLLNREYCAIERQVSADQQRHLLDRSLFLDGQIEGDYVRPAGDGDRWEIVQQQRPQSKQQQNTQPQAKQTTQQQRTGSAKKKPTIRHLYRPANQKPDGDNLKTKWGDLVSEQTNPEKDCLLNKLSNGNIHRDLGDYADPQRYTSSGLYEDPIPLGRQSRPVSGTEQRRGDAARARPKSAVLPKGERPLRYETTRPVLSRRPSADAHLGQKRAPNARPPSGKQAGHTFITTTNGDDLQMHIDLHDLTVTDPADHQVAEEADTRAVRRNHDYSAAVERLRLPASVTQYQADVSAMGRLEADFRQRTAQLQKQLGIPTSGMVL